MVRIPTISWFPTGRLSLPAWHLVGGLDPLDASELTGNEPDDGYPVLLADWIERDGLTCLKVKLRGNDPAWDYDRLVGVGEIAMTHGVPWLTADFNCTVLEPAYVNEILDRLVLEHPRIYGMILYVEQPFPYDLENNRIDVHSVSARKPLFMDESAHDWRLVRLGRSLGWTGVALKTCKTQTGALLSLCWAKAHGMTLMVQDLTNPMLAQIPHVLLAAHAGTIMGVETNAMQFYPDASLAEEAVHPGLYRRRHGVLESGQHPRAGIRLSAGRDRTGVAGTSRRFWSRLMSDDLSRLCIHTITTKPWSIEEAVEQYAAAGVAGITVWRQWLDGRDPQAVGERIRAAGLTAVSLCRGGFFPAASASARQDAIDDNLRAVDEAAAIGAPLIVLVCGAAPDVPLPEARKQIQDWHRSGPALCRGQRRQASHRTVAPHVRRQPFRHQHPETGQRPLRRHRLALGWRGGRCLPSVVGPRPGVGDQALWSIGLAGRVPHLRLADAHQSICSTTAGSWARAASPSARSGAGWKRRDSRGSTKLKSFHTGTGRRTSTNT